MKKISTDTLIVGAGPAGMATAIELLKSGADFLVVDKQTHVGGLSKTYEFSEVDEQTGEQITFLTDNGPHRFFSKNPYLYEFIADLLSEKWIKVHRQTRQYIDGKFYDYPVNALQALRNLGFKTAFVMGVDYFFAKVKYGLFKFPIKNFEDYVFANFGRTLGRFNMINYTEKIWGIPSNTIHQDWASQRIKGLNLTSLVKDTFIKFFSRQSKSKPKSLIDEFFYPDRGTGLIYEAIKTKIEKSGRQVMLSTFPTNVFVENSKITRLILSTPDGPIEVTCKNLVESVPITEFIKIIEPKSPKSVMEAQKFLKHRSQVYLFLTLNKESITKDQWIYFPSKNIPFARISEMRNFSEKMSPKGKTSLFVEFFCNEGDEFWNMSADDLFVKTLPIFEKMNLFTRAEVRKYYLIKQKNAYPVYDVDYQKYLSELKRYLDCFKNLYYIGRPGRFRYNNQDHSLEMGILAARSIVEGKRYNIEEIGDSKEYYESGTVWKKK